MGFGSKQLDEAFDRWITQTPEEYYWSNEEEIDTKLEGLETANIDLGKRQHQVYNALLHLEYATNNMISRFLSIPINQVTPRIFELRSAGLVVFSHTSRCPITKRTAKYWRIGK